MEFLSTSRKLILTRQSRVGQAKDVYSQISLLSRVTNDYFATEDDNETKTLNKNKGITLPK